jgi:type IV pilus assembly protein PilQ
MKARLGIFLAVFMLVAVSLASAAAPALSSLKFKDTEIATVLKAIEKKADLEGKKITIVTTPEVFGLVTVDLENVDWKTAFKVILKMCDLGYTQDGSILTVSTLAKIAEDQKKEDDTIFASGGMKIEAFKLKHVEAADVAKMITPFLTKDGKVSVLDVVNKQGWGFSASTSGMINVGDNSSGSGSSYSQPTAPTNTTKMTRTKILAVSDTPIVVRQVGKLIEEMDTAPKQVLIRAILLEVVENKYFDLGVNFGTTDALGKAGDIFNKDYQLGTASRFIGTGVDNPTSGKLASLTSGFKFGFSKIEGTQFEVVIRALQEDENTNTLSTPTILTMDGREATILVGEQFPIIDTTSSTMDSNTVGGSLNYYQNIGIQLRVVPQICGDNDDKVNLIVHPTVSNQNGTVKIGGTTATSTSGTDNPIAEYPIIDTREAETQMVIDDGDTVVMGGLLSDSKKKDLSGVPYLSDIPFLGKIFDRISKNREKKDLLIFLTVKIVRPSTVLPADVVDRTKIDQITKGI